MDQEQQAAIAAVLLNETAVERRTTERQAAYDRARAAGVEWQALGRALRTHPDTLRHRYGGGAEGVAQRRERDRMRKAAARQAVRPAVA